MFVKNLLIVLLALLSLTSTVFAKQFNAVVVYGDSLSDNGNLYQYSGQPGAPYYDGRRSNGPVAVEQLASTLGAPLIDFAWIGATTGVGNYADDGTALSSGTFGLPGMAPIYAASKSSLGPFKANGLFIVWGGPNDILALPLDPLTIQRAVTNELAIITDLKAIGVQTILAPGMPDLGLTPYFKSQGPAFAAWGTALTDAFNAALQAQLPDCVLYYDTAALFRDLVNNPAAYGFTNATDYYLNALSGDPNGYVFFDDFHPTTAAHALLAREFAAAAAVPEPTTILMVGMGIGALVILRRRKG